MEFKNIAETNDRYEVNINGIVRSIKNGKIIKPFIVRDYLCYMLRPVKIGGSKTFKLHRLIAIYFIPNPLNKETVNHKDGNKLNNDIGNLEWMTRSENELHSYRVLGKTPNKSFLGKFNEDNLSSKKVKQLELNRKLVKVWPSISEISRNGFTLSNVSKCCNGLQKSHKGYFWEFIN